MLIPGAPLGLLTTAVQALAGILLPSASVFLLLLCNDREVLGPWLNPRWLNIVAAFIIGVLLVLSGTLVVTTLFSRHRRGQGRHLDRRRAGGRCRPGRGVVRADPRTGGRRVPPHPRATMSAGRTDELAHAAARPAQAGGVVRGTGSSACWPCYAATW